MPKHGDIHNIKTSKHIQSHSLSSQENTAVVLLLLLSCSFVAVVAFIVIITLCFGHTAHERSCQLKLFEFENLNTHNLYTQRPLVVLTKGRNILLRLRGHAVASTDLF